MDLERKPAEKSKEPGYPKAEEYISDRRRFLFFLGLTTVAGAGVYALDRSGMLKAKPSGSSIGTPKSVPPDIRTRGVAPSPYPQNAPDPEKIPVESQPANVRPERATKGEMPPVQPEPPRVQPQADAEGDVVVPELQAVEVRPLTDPAGGIRAPKMPGTPPPPQPQAVPRANIRGRMVAPKNWQPEETKTNQDADEDF